MGRPKLDLQGNTIGTLVLGPRVPSVHTRYMHRCKECNHVGETDVRYLSNGCINCNRMTVNSAIVKKEPTSDILVATEAEAYYLKPARLAITLRTHPKAVFYFKGKRVTVVETEHDVILQSPAHAGTENFKTYDKINQELDGQDYLDGNSGLTASFADELEEPAKLEADPTPPPPTFQTPEGWLKLVDRSEAKYLAEYSEYDAPPYIQDWLDENPGCTYAMIATGGGHYARATKRAFNSLEDDFDTDELDKDLEALKVNALAHAKAEHEAWRATKSPEELAILDETAAKNVAAADAERAARKELLQSRFS